MCLQHKMKYLEESPSNICNQNVYSSGTPYIDLKCSPLSRHIFEMNKLISPFLIKLFDAVIVADSIQRVRGNPETDGVGRSCRRPCIC